MNAEFWKTLRTSPRELAYWALILAVVIAAAIFLVTSRGNAQKARSAEETATAGRVQIATATAEARAEIATATAEARSPRTGD